MDSKIICLMLLLGLYGGTAVQARNCNITTTAPPTTTPTSTTTLGVLISPNPDTTTPPPTTTIPDTDTFTTVSTTTIETTMTAPPSTTPCKPFTSTELAGEELTRLFNSPVYKAEWMVRPLDDLPVIIGPISHTGVRVTLCDGSQWLIHKGPGYGKDSETVVTSATHMSDRWKTLCTKDFKGKKTVSELMNAAGTTYNLLFNCHVASITIMFQ
ncbi:hypothetical protein NL108_013102 [Boleophthalmus pectinirostris]|uniref:mucin-2-like n=1 Tax=Boleophthalmus pectinirostris TaxID=150288 RepID=UPI000A1C2964|nr:mucin-2-like [Boleophthalmus pectinirostris]KAJ0065539.1 hypothetical protein NL108_013102 [Boleophthalmus pectinirostris]